MDEPPGHGRFARGRCETSTGVRVHARAGVSARQPQPMEAWYGLRRPDHLCQPGLDHSTRCNSADSASLAEGSAGRAPAAERGTAHLAGLRHLGISGRGRPPDQASCSRIRSQLPGASTTPSRCRVRTITLSGRWSHGRSTAKRRGCPASITIRSPRTMRPHRKRPVRRYSVVDQGDVR